MHPSIPIVKRSGFTLLGQFFNRTLVALPYLAVGYVGAFVVLFYNGFPLKNMFPIAYSQGLEHIEFQAQAVEETYGLVAAYWVEKDEPRWVSVSN